MINANKEAIKNNGSISHEGNSGMQYSSVLINQKASSPSKALVEPANANPPPDVSTIEETP